MLLSFNEKIMWTRWAVNIQNNCAFLVRQVCKGTYQNKTNQIQFTMRLASTTISFHIPYPSSSAWLKDTYIIENSFPFHNSSDFFCFCNPVHYEFMFMIIKNKTPFTVYPYSVDTQVNVCTFRGYLFYQSIKSIEHWRCLVFRHYSLFHLILVHFLFFFFVVLYRS